MAKSSTSTSRGDYGTLLVNFPSHCRLSSSSSDSSCKEEEAKLKLSSTATADNNNNKPVSVRFAEKGLITFIDLPDHDERRERWFFEDDIDTFKRRMLQERHRISSKLTTTTTPIDNDDLIMCIGMEKLLTPKLSRIVKQRQLDHLHSILAEQERQEVENIIDEEAIASLSEQNSEWTRRRAHKLATAYWDNLKVVEEDEGSDDQRRSST